MAIRSFALLLFSTGAAPIAGNPGSPGSPGCPCLASFAQYGLPDDAPLDAKISDVSYSYPAGYGIGGCAAHDQGLPPNCQAPGKPSWCADNWCYVDPSNCNLVSTQGTYFTTDLYFSYRTCGATNTYSLWFESGGNQTHELFELVDVASGYLRSAVTALEVAEGEIRNIDISNGCSFHTSCDCCGCAKADPWSGPESPNSVSFSHTTTTPFPPSAPAPPNIDTCLSEVVSDQFDRVAAVEGDVSRPGYEYYGSQLGTYMQWPGIQWCPSQYDPRFRPWFSGGVSGPKDLVIVIDTSGSMTGTRIGMAEKAATQVVDTLTASDYAAVVAFDGGVSAWQDQLVKMTEVSKSAAKTWIGSNIKASGGTNYRSAFSKIWQILEATGSSTSSCHRLVLFLSDGEPNNWDTADYNDVSTKATLHNSLILTYALGSGAPAAILKQIACQNGGIFYPVADSDNLGDVMASYYSLLSPMLEPCQVRFTEYEDWFTKKKLLSACVPAYKKAARFSPSTCSAEYNATSVLTEAPHLIGVACLDMQLIASDEKLHAHPGWTDFWALVTNQMKACPRRTISESALEQLRAQVSSQSVCTSASAVTLNEHASYTQRTGTSHGCPTSPPPPPAPVSPPAAPEDDSLGIGAIIGIAAGGGAVVVVIIGAAFYYGLRAAAPPRPPVTFSTPRTPQPPVVEGVVMGRPV